MSCGIFIFFSLVGIQLIGRWKNRLEQSVPQFTSNRDERAKMLVNFRISKPGNVVMELSEKLSLHAEEKKGRLRRRRLVFHRWEIMFETASVLEVNAEKFGKVFKTLLTVVIVWVVQSQNS